MENEQQTSEQVCMNCGGKGCGKWHHKHWKRRGGGCGGGLWAVGWLFTIGFLKFTFWKGVLAIILWPYFLGVFFTR